MQITSDYSSTKQLNALSTVAAPMAPSAIDDIVSRREAWKSLATPTLHPVKEARFGKFVAPQIDGRETALTQPEDKRAIVIDNGANLHLVLLGSTAKYWEKLMSYTVPHDRVLSSPSRMVVRATAPNNHPSHNGKVPRQKAGKDILLCG